MAHPAVHRTAAVRYLPGRATMAVAIAGTALGWLLAVGGLVGTIQILPDVSWPGMIFPVLLAGSVAVALWATRRAMTFRRLWRNAPAALLEQRSHGDLSAISDSDRRPLRPVGTTAAKIAARTDSLLTGLITLPNVQIFRGIRPTGTTLPLTSHAVSAGRLLVFVESVAWPPGWYRMDADGRIRCDGQYIGQSIRPLVTSVRRAQRLLPRSHRVSALIVVHRTAGSTYVLPAPSRELVWVLADDVTRHLRDRLAQDPWTVSRHTVAALTSDAAAPVATP